MRMYSFAVGPTYLYIFYFVSIVSLCLFNKALVSGDSVGMFCFLVCFAMPVVICGNS